MLVIIKFLTVAALRYFVSLRWNLTLPRIEVKRFSGRCDLGFLGTVPGFPGSLPAHRALPSEINQL